MRLATVQQAEWPRPSARDSVCVQGLYGQPDLVDVLWNKDTNCQSLIEIEIVIYFGIARLDLKSKKMKLKKNRKSNLRIIYLDNDVLYYIRVGKRGIRMKRTFVCHLIELALI